MMGIAHRTLPIYGVQFHPESIASEHGHRLLGNFLRLAGHNVQIGGAPPAPERESGGVSDLKPLIAIAAGGRALDESAGRAGLRHPDVGRCHAVADRRLPDVAARARRNGAGDRRRGARHAGQDASHRGAGTAPSTPAAPVATAPARSTSPPVRPSSRRRPAFRSPSMAIARPPPRPARPMCWPRSASISMPICAW